MSALLPITYADIEYALMHDRAQRHTVMPRYTPTHWWECDVIEITGAGYMREYEIKMSLQDFRADAKKERLAWGYPRVPEHKHTQLATGDKKGPNYFFYVCPSGVLPIEQIPVWAGLIEVSRVEWSNYPALKIVKAAPKLHGEKKEDSFRTYITGTAYGRLHAVWSQNYYDGLCRALNKAQKAKLLCRKMPEGEAA